MRDGPQSLYVLDGKTPYIGVDADDDSAPEGLMDILSFIYRLLQLPDSTTLCTPRLNSYHVGLATYPFRHSPDVSTVVSEIRRDSEILYLVF